jgi:molybdopterin converting factor small subunit
MELKEILEILDISEEVLAAENPQEAFTNAVRAKYLTKDQALNDKDIVSKVSGKFFGPLNTKLKQIGGLTHSEIEGKKIEEIIDMIGEKFTGEITSLKEASTKGNDEKLTALTEELEKHKKTANKYKTDLDALSTTYQEAQNKWTGELKNYKIQTLLNQERSKVPFVDTVKPIEVEGYNSVISKKYKFDLDEKDNLVVYNESGEPIQNPKKVGSYFSPVDVLTQEAASNGILKQNNASTTQEKKTFTVTSTQKTQPDNGRKLNSAAADHANVLKA